MAFSSSFLFMDVYHFRITRILPATFLSMTLAVSLTIMLKERNVLGMDVFPQLVFSRAFSIRTCNSGISDNKMICYSCRVSLGGPHISELITAFNPSVFRGDLRSSPRVCKVFSLADVRRVGRTVQKSQNKYK
jgi:hypothetical protein